MKREIIRSVLEANLSLKSSGLVLFTWGNVSAIDRDTGEVVIKPSGVPYSELNEESLPITDLEGHILRGGYRPSSDLMTHLALYKAFPKCGSVAHTHSRMAVAWAQAGLDIPPLGTTHADYFYGPVPCTRNLTDAEIEGKYEAETGKVIAETFAIRGLDPVSMPGVLVYGHGPFVWGTDAMNCVHNAVVLEEMASMAYYTNTLAPDAEGVSKALLDRHYLRKHGKNA
jgi:L-ribulose-5-phosphate 4-epimerase